VGHQIETLEGQILWPFRVLAYLTRGGPESAGLDAGRAGHFGEHRHAEFVGMQCGTQQMTFLWDGLMLLGPLAVVSKRFVMV